MSAPFVATYRQFPTDDPHNLERQLVNFHTQVASAVNNRIISTFQLHTAGNVDFIPNGERWFPSSGVVLRDGNRLVVQVSDSILTVAHNIPKINLVTRLYGTFYDGTNWWPLPYVDVAAANNQINVKVNSTNVVVTKGAGAPPTISTGIVVVEWV